VYLSRSEKNRLQYAFAAEGDGAGGGLRWQDLGVEADKPPFRLAIERVKAEDGQRAFRFLMNGKVVDTKKSAIFTATENVTIGAFGEALRGEKWKAAVLRVRVIEEKRK
jgi:hypothetical protein